MGSEKAGCAPVKLRSARSSFMGLGGVTLASHTHVPCTLTCSGHGFWVRRPLWQGCQWALCPSSWRMLGKDALGEGRRVAERGPAERGAWHRRWDCGEPLLGAR